MENNNENKARFFAQYLGSKIFYPDTDSKIMKAKLTSVGFDEIQTTYFRRKKHSAGYTVGDILSFNPTNVFHNSDAKNAYLELTPLSEISDEDAIEISMMFSDNQNLCKELHADRGKRILNSGKVKIKSVDYLRSKGYALPFHDLSVEDLINYGWIRLKNNGSQPNPKQ